MDHLNQRVRSGRTNTASKLFIVNFIFQNMVHPFHHDGFKNLWNNWGKWNWTNIFFDRPWRFFFGSGITCAVLKQTSKCPSLCGWKGWFDIDSRFQIHQNAQFWGTNCWGSYRGRGTAPSLAYWEQLSKISPVYWILNQVIYIRRLLKIQHKCSSK